MTDHEKITNLLDTQHELANRLEIIAEIADTYAKQVGDGPLLANIRHGFDRIAHIARGNT